MSGRILRPWAAATCTIIGAILGSPMTVIADDGDQAIIEQLLEVGAKGQGNAKATGVVSRIQKMDADVLPVILKVMNSADELSFNWLQIAFESIVDRTLASDNELPIDALKKYLANRGNNDRARSLVFNVIAKQEPDNARKMIPEFLDDPSSELRRKAVAVWIERAKDFKTNNEKSQSVAAYKEALKGATDEDQVNTIAAALKEAGKPVDLQKHFGFLPKWALIGPFDNVDEKGFDVVYPPEKEFNRDKTYAGQLGQVGWKSYATEDPYGVLDIAAETKPYKGAITYAYTEFVSAKDQPVDFRLATPNAWKLWVNGKLVFAREEYHRGTFFDQYRIPGGLKAGKNTILLKVCQNEQDDHWAQKWQIQFRICDPAGKALQPVVGEKTASRK